MGGDTTSLTFVPQIPTALRVDMREMGCEIYATTDSKPSTVELVRTEDINTGNSAVMPCHTSCHLEHQVRYTGECLQVLQLSRSTMRWSMVLRPYHISRAPQQQHVPLPCNETSVL